MAHVAESSIDQTGDELASSDEERADSHQLTSLMRGGNLSYVYRNCHRGNAWWEKKKELHFDMYSKTSHTSYVHLSVDKIKGMKDKF